MSDDHRDYRPGVGIMLLNPDRHVFVGRRIVVAGWQMPQGGIDPGETPAEAALRELQEETGTDKAEIIAETRGWLCYDLPDTIRAGWLRRFRGQCQKWFVMRFAGDDGDIDLNRHHPE